MRDQEEMRSKKIVQNVKKTCIEGAASRYRSKSFVEKTVSLMKARYLRKRHEGGWF